MIRNNSRIDYIYFSNTAPTDKNVLWLTFVNGKFVLKIYNNGVWQDVTTDAIKEVKVVVDNSTTSAPTGFGSIDAGILSILLSGIKGEKGDSVIGPRGPQGITGPQGPLGLQGPAGYDGTVTFEELTEELKELLRGPQGMRGLQGELGTRGEIGPQGPLGERGPMGPLGETCAYDPNDPNTPVFQLATTTGQSQTVAMTLKAITDELDEVDLWEETLFDVSKWGALFDAIGSNNVFEHYTSPSKRGGLFIPIEGGETFRVVKGTVPSYRIEFLTDYTHPPVAGSTPAWATENPIGTKIDEERIYEAPNTAKWMYVQRYSGDIWRIPTIYLRKRKIQYKEKIDSIASLDVSSKIYGVKVLEGYALYNDDLKQPPLAPHSSSFVTDFIPCKYGDDVAVYYGSNVAGLSCIHWYDQYKNYMGFQYANSNNYTAQYAITLNTDGFVPVAYFRLCYRTRGWASVNGELVFNSDWIDNGINGKIEANLIGQTYEQEYSITGSGSTAVAVNIGHLKPGARYKLIIDDPEPWETGAEFLTHKNSRFYILANNGSSVTHVHYATTWGMPIPSTLEFTAKENAYYLIGGRAASGVVAKCRLLRPIGDNFDGISELIPIIGDLSALRIRDNIWNNATFVPTYQEVEPDINDVLNSVRHTNAYPSNNYHAYNKGTSPDRNYLSWFPKVWVAGGGILTLNLTGVRGVSISEWPWRELNVGLRSTGYGNADLIKHTGITVATVQAANNVVTLKLLPETKRIVITFNYGADCTPSLIVESITSATLPVASFDNWTFKSKDTDEEEEVVVEEVKENAHDLLSLAKEAHWVRSKDPKPNPVLGLLHYSDIHTSNKAASQIKLARVKYGAYIDDILSTGDSVEVTAIYPNNPTKNAKLGLQWWLDTELAPFSLYSVGNHDVNIQDNPDMTREECFDYYFAPFIEGWGVTSPTGWDDSESIHYKATYWHKDYTAQKIRLINIDAVSHFDGILDPATGEILEAGVNYTSNSQELWLIEKLNETLPGSGNAAEGFSVVISAHYPLDDCEAENSEWDDSIHKWVGNQSANGGIVVKQDGCIKSNWHCQYNNEFTADASFNMRNGRYKGSVNNIGNILEYWMGGYVPAVDTANKNPNELGWYEKTTVDGKYAYVLTEDTSVSNSKLYYIKSNVEGADFIVWLCGHTHKDMFFYPSRYPNILNIGAQMAGDQRDQYYMSRGDVALTANLVFISNSYGLIKIIRVGNSSNLYLRPTTYLCYDYKNRKVISEG